MDRHNRKYKKSYINAYLQIPVPYGSKLHIPPTNYIQKCLTFNGSCLRVFVFFVVFFWGGGESGEWTVSKNMAKTERARGLGRKIREEIGKGNPMTALRFQTGGRQTYDIPGLLSGDLCSKCIIVEIGARKNFHNETSLKYVHVNVFKAVIVDI